MRIAYLGNHVPTHSTESHVSLSLESLGHEVTRIQEGATLAVDVPRQVEGHDLFLWTQTYSLAEQGGTVEDRALMVKALRDVAPSAGFHLDRWWGLSREPQVREQPFFRCDVMFTADGGHDQEWFDAGIKHVWLPPAVFHGEAVDERRSGRYRADVAFVGSWNGYGHEEWRPYRDELISKLEGWYGDRFRKWPRFQAVRGHELNQLYASTKVVVGDSCLAGSAKRYWSDRIPETIGRGGFLVHPSVQGLEEVHDYVPMWAIEDWDFLHGLIETWLGDPVAREEHRQEMAADVRANHTYRNRMQTLIECMGAL